jgi:hypothetical protein
MTMYDEVDAQPHVFLVTRTIYRCVFCITYRGFEMWAENSQQARRWEGCKASSNILLQSFVVVYACRIEIILVSELCNRAQNNIRRSKIMYGCETGSRFLSWQRLLSLRKYVTNIVDIIQQYDHTNPYASFLINRSTYLLFSVT